MKKIILAAALCATVISCKQEKTMTYKYADKPQTVTCDNVDAKLYSEAYYAFENAIVMQAKNTNRRPNFNITPEYALRNFLRRSAGIIKITDYATQEAFEIFHKLKDQAIWDGPQLKSNAAITECIGSSIENNTTKTSFNTLRSVESLDPKLMAAAINDNRGARNQFSDKALMTYVALDLYYAKFFNTDFSQTEFLVEKEAPAAIVPQAKPSQPVIGKKLDLDVKKREEHNAHDGHNH